MRLGYLSQREMMTKRRPIATRSVTASAASVVRRRSRKDAPLTPEGVFITPNVVDAALGDSPVIDLIKACPRTFGRFREGDRLHVSDVVSKCLRKLALVRRLGATLPSEVISESLRITFAQGEAIHDYVKARLASGHPDSVYGKWVCPCGSHTTLPMTATEALREGECTHCSKPATRYVEIQVLDKELPITGSPDVLFYLHQHRAFHILEIKSISASMWDDLVRPQPDHVIQVLTYWYLMKQHYNVMDEVSILYANKGYVFKLPYKEFTIRPSEVVGRLTEYLDDVRQYAESLGGGGLPDRRLCISPSSAEAKKCTVCAVCFAGG